MKKIVCVLIIFLVIGVGCNVGNLDFDKLEISPMESFMALPLGEMTYSMQELMGEITESDSNFFIDEFDNINILYTDEANYSFSQDGSISVDRSDTIPVARQDISLDFFSNFGGPGIEFENPQLNFTFRNSLAMPVAIDFSGLFAVRLDSVTGESDTLFLSGPIAKNPQTIGSPGPSEIGTVVETVISVNNSNSNIRDLFEISPTIIAFNLKLITNPSGSNGSGVVNSGAGLQTQLEIKLPMAVRITDFEKAVEFLVSDVEFDEADSVIMRIVTLNLLPFSTEFTMQIIDDSDSVLFETETKQVMATPFLDRFFEANAPETNIANIILPIEGIDALNSASKLLMKLTLNTPSTLNTTDIFAPLLSRYSLEIKISVAGRIKREF